MVTIAVNQWIVVRSHDSEIVSVTKKREGFNNGKKESAHAANGWSDSDFVRHAFAGH
jgi:hypothetical protein